MTYVRTAALVASLGLFAVSAQAADEDDAATAAAEVPEISGTFGVGAVRASGNTDSRSASIEVNAEIAFEVWRHKLRLTGYQASEEGDDTAERYQGSVQSDYRLTKRDYLFVNGSHQSDKFGAFDRRSSLTAGYGRRLYEGDGVTLDLEAGGGRRVSEPDGTNDRVYDNIVRLFGEFDWAFSSSSRFTQTLEVEAGEDDTETQSVSAIRSSLGGDLSLRLSHTVTHNSDVPADTESTDTFTSVAVDYAF